MVVRIALEGNISAGKSTLLSILAESLSFLVVPEPLEKWQAVPVEDDDACISESQDAGCNLLDYFYSDTKRWAYTFQTYAFLSRIRAQLRPFEEFADNSSGSMARTSTDFQSKSENGLLENSETKRQRMNTVDETPTAIACVSIEDELAGLSPGTSDNENGSFWDLQDGISCVGSTENCSVRIVDVQPQFVDIMCNVQAGLYTVRTYQPVEISHQSGTQAGKYHAVAANAVEPLYDQSRIALPDGKCLKFQLLQDSKLHLSDASKPRYDKLNGMDNLTDKILLYERSVLSDRYCFAANCRTSGLFQELEWRVYCDWHTWLLKTFDGLKLDGLVYMRTTPKTCYQRLQKRARDEESGVSLEYLEQLHQRHEEWLIHKKVAKDYKLPVLVIDADTEFESNPQRSAEISRLIKQFVKQLEERKQKKSSDVSKDLKKDLSTKKKSETSKLVLS